MKLSCIPTGMFRELCAERTMPLHEWYEMAARLGLDGIEMYDRYLTDFSQSACLAEARRLHDLGLEASMFTGYGDLTHPDPGQWQAAVDEVKRNVELALLFHCTIVRVVAGGVHAGLDREGHLANAARGLTECLGYAAQRGVHLAFEDHPQFGTRIEDFVEIIERVDSPDLKVNLDTSNPMESGQTGVELARRVKDRVVHVHASDRLRDLSHVEIGKGDVDFPALFRILKREAGYDGWISLESAGSRGEATVRDSIAYVRRTWDAL